MSPGKYVALCPHYFAVQMGDILSQETYCPGSVRRHFVPGDTLSRLATNGNFWTDIDILRTDIDILRTDIDIWRTDIDILRTDIDILRTYIDFGEHNRISFDILRNCVGKFITLLC